MAPQQRGEPILGLKSLNIGEREALEIVCDGAHRGEPPTAWFDCGSDLGNLALALVIGWTEWRNTKRKWFCPQCAHRNALKRSSSRNAADEVLASKDAA
jgi:hypothetical protein